MPLSAIVEDTETIFILRKFAVPAACCLSDSQLPMDGLVGMAVGYALIDSQVTKRILVNHFSGQFSSVTD